MIAAADIAELENARLDHIATAICIGVAIVDRVPLALMDRLIQHPNRWAPVVEAAKPAIVAMLGAAYHEDAWEDGKHEAWLLYAEHHNFEGWPSARPV